jgi:ubiquitin-conjugating enzyme E2 J2
MAAASSMLAPKASRRIQRELSDFRLSPPPFVPKIGMSDDNMRRLYFLIEGPTDSPYEGGEYILCAELASDYPMSAPVIRMLTPSGRFDVNQSICTTFTHYHPELWSPTYNFTNILISFVSFMMDDETGVGSIKTGAEERKMHAANSKIWNIAHDYYRFFA